ncbi:MAG: hypothetical protein K5659_09130, partial [Lachnospiraceae bacterium]|nr:hypothetical protein [Lachnospiraceae bacterium]
QVIETAYIYAKNYVAYGIDITKAWDTAVTQAAILHSVKMDSFYEGYSKCREQVFAKIVGVKDVDFETISAENKVFLETLSKRCNELVASGKLPIAYMWDWFLNELGLPYSRSEIFEEIRRKIDENN